MAILNHLHERGVSTVVTTHLSELKAFAYEHEGVENASCEFNTETLKPTYRLIMGLPGGSCALAVASRLGLPEEVIESARNRLGEDRIQVDAMIAELEQTMRRLNEEKEEITRIREEQEALKELKETEIRRLQQARHKILQQAKDEADNNLREARADVA